MANPSDHAENERLSLTRALRHRLESLKRAGIDRMPAPPVYPAVRKLTVDTRPPERSPSVQSSPVPEPAVPRPTKPAPMPIPVASLFGDEMETPIVPDVERPERLAALGAEVAACTKCPLLATTRTQTVFGTGSPTARLMFIGEAPGGEEDRTGIPFVGRAGQLLTDMITKGMGLSREDVYIANILKSRPPENRNPLPEEIANCLPFLERQIAIVRPEFLCMLGKVAASTLLETALPLGKLRGRWHRYRGVATIVTYHPAFLLRNPASKKEAWEDLQMLMKAMGLTPPSRQKES